MSERPACAACGHPTIVHGSADECRSGHLPECPLSYVSKVVPPDVMPDCICDRLRACEQRVTTQTAVLWATHGRDQFDLGVQAAREAVEDLNNVTYETALAAIDALKQN